jgi:hypothetical protein
MVCTSRDSKDKHLFRLMRRTLGTHGPLARGLSGPSHFRVSRKAPIRSLTANPDTSGARIDIDLSCEHSALKPKFKFHSAIESDQSCALESGRIPSQFCPGDLLPRGWPSIAIECRSHSFHALLHVSSSYGGKRQSQGSDSLSGVRHFGDSDAVIPVHDDHLSARDYFVAQQQIRRVLDLVIEFNHRARGQVQYFSQG